MSLLLDLLPLFQDRGPLPPNTEGAGSSSSGATGVGEVSTETQFALSTLATEKGGLALIRAQRGGLASVLAAGALSVLDTEAGGTASAKTAGAQSTNDQQAAGGTLGVERG